jgi:hypothetical protein
LTHLVHIFPVAGDVHPADNSDTCFRVVVGSYDPNFKEVTPAGSGPTGRIPPATSELIYTVHFQNTGTFPAERVKVIDTLSSFVDPSSLELVDRSQPNYPMNMAVNGNVVTFDFNPTWLPDSILNEPESHGYVSFRVNLLPGLPDNTTIANQAYIFFDLNEPVVTNTTLNTIDISLATHEQNRQLSLVNVYPNPSTGKIDVSFSLSETADVEFVMYDILGKTILKTQSGLLSMGKHVRQLDLGELQLTKGIYTLSVKWKDRSFNKKIIFIGKY